MPLFNILKRISGFSTPFFGMSWSLTSTEREITQGLITYLEDQRIFQMPLQVKEYRRSWWTLWLIPIAQDVKYIVSQDDMNYAIESASEIRKNLSDTMENLDRESSLFLLIAPMREACRIFLEASMDRETTIIEDDEFEFLLGNLKQAFSKQITQICRCYKIEISKSSPLFTIF